MEGNYICKQFRFVLGICMPAKSLQSYPILCDPMDYSPPGSSVHGILQARILDWVAIPSSGDLSDPGIKPRESFHIAGGLLTI